MSRPAKVTAGTTSRASLHDLSQEIGLAAAVSESGQAFTCRLQVRQRRAALLRPAPLGVAARRTSTTTEMR